MYKTNPHEKEKSKNIKVGGIYTQKVKENNERIGYDLVAVQTNKSEIFLRIEGNENLDKIGIFSIFPKALALGIESLKPENNKENQVVIIDEIGKLELENRAWAKGLDELIQFNKSHLLLVVREDITEKIIEKWNFQNYFVFNLNENQSQNIEKKIMETFN